MKINNIHYRTIWVKRNDPCTIQIIDQRFLPHQFVIEDLTNLDGIIRAIRDMHVRGAPLIGVTAAYGIYFALLEVSKSRDFENDMEKAIEKLRKSRPTAVNLEWAIQKQLKTISSAQSMDGKIQAAFEMANQMADEGVKICEKIGDHGLKLIEEISRRKNAETIYILTHCNAGWLACVDWGTATAPIYKAFDQGIPLHVWVSETRPRNQGASLTAWEFVQQGIPHTVIADNAAGHLLQRGMVDFVIVGTDRTTGNGDVTNKIGTYLKALAAKESHVPFYVAVPSSSLDWNIQNINEIPIEERNPDEVKYIEGLHNGEIKKILLTPKESPAKNYAFDITPARFISGLITERGVCQANRESILRLFPEKLANMQRDEGVIKFHCRWIQTELIARDRIQELNEFRNRLYDLGFIGTYEDGIGFGNISIRTKGNKFIISGTQTGGIPKLDERYYTEVIDFNLEENSITCKGPVKASSESLTHAVLYRLLRDINAVLHIHHPDLWSQLLNHVPTTSKNIPYGTPEMAAEVEKLLNETDIVKKKIFVMAGHEDGIVAFGRNLTEAANQLLSHANNFLGLKTNVIE